MVVIRIPRVGVGGGAAPLPTGRLPEGTAELGQDVAAGFEAAARGVEERARQAFLQDARRSAAEKRLLASGAVTGDAAAQAQQAWERADRQVRQAMGQEWEQSRQLLLADALDTENPEAPETYDELAESLRELDEGYMDRIGGMLRSDQGRADWDLYTTLWEGNEARPLLDRELYYQFDKNRAEIRLQEGVDLFIGMPAPITPDRMPDTEGLGIRLGALKDIGDADISDPATIQMLELHKQEFRNEYGAAAGIQYDMWVYDSQAAIRDSLGTAVGKDQFNVFLEESVENLKSHTLGLMVDEPSDELLQEAATLAVMGQPPGVAERAYLEQADQAIGMLRWMIERDQLDSTAANSAIMGIQANLGALVDARATAEGVVLALADAGSRLPLNDSSEAAFDLAWPALQTRLDANIRDRAVGLSAILNTYNGLPKSAANYVRALDLSTDDNVIMLAGLMAPYLQGQRRSPQVQTVDGGLYSLKQAIPDDQWKMLAIAANKLVQSQGADAAEAVGMARAWQAMVEDSKSLSPGEREVRESNNKLAGGQASERLLSGVNVVAFIKEQVGVELDAFNNLGDQTLVARVIDLAHVEMQLNPNVTAEEARMVAMTTVLSSYGVVEYPELGKRLEYLHPSIVPGATQEMVWDDVITKLRGIGMGDVAHEEIRFLPVVNPEAPFDISQYRWLVTVTREGTSIFAREEGGEILSYTPEWETSATALRDTISATADFMNQEQPELPTEVRDFNRLEVAQLQADFFGRRTSYRPPRGGPLKRSKPWQTLRPQVAGGYWNRDQAYIDLYQKVYDRAYADKTIGGAYPFRTRTSIDSELVKASRERYAKRLAEAAAWNKFVTGKTDAEVEERVFAKHRLNAEVPTEEWNIEHLGSELKRLQGAVMRENLDEAVRELKEMYGVAVDFMGVGE